MKLFLFISIVFSSVGQADELIFNRPYVLQSSTCRDGSIPSGQNLVMVLRLLTLTFTEQGIVRFSHRIFGELAVSPYAIRDGILYTQRKYPSGTVGSTITIRNEQITLQVVDEPEGSEDANCADGSNLVQVYKIENTFD